jgi:hypothetical protein
MSDSRSGSPRSRTKKTKPPIDAAVQRAALSRAIEAVWNAAGDVPAQAEKIVPALQAMIAQFDGLPRSWEKSLVAVAPISKRMRPSPEWPPRWQEIYSALAQPVWMMTCFKLAIAASVDPDASHFHPDSLLLTVDKLLTWEPICRDAAAKLRDKLERLRSRAQRTWVAGDAIRSSILRAVGDLTAIIADPPRGITRKRTAQRAAAVRASLPAVMGFDGAPLLDDLAHAVDTDITTDAAARERQETFSIAQLRDMTGLANDALKRYTGRAGVPTATRGKRNHQFTAEHVRLILQTIAENSSEELTLARCRGALEWLARNPNQIR